MKKIFEVYEFKVRVDIFRYYSFRDGRTGKEFQRLTIKFTSNKQWDLGF